LNPQRPEPQSGALPVELLPPHRLIIAMGPPGCQRSWQAVADRMDGRSRFLVVALLGLTRKPGLAANADVLESQGAQTGGIEQILGVHDQWTFEQVLDAVKVQAAELGPASAHDQGIHALSDGVG
jgi:hypothetical protein